MKKLSLVLALLLSSATSVGGWTFAPDGDTLAYWIFDESHESNGSFQNEVDGGSPVAWSTDTPSFVTKDGSQGVVCSYDDNLHGTAQSTEYTVFDPNEPIVTYGVRFLLKEPPSIGGGGRYSHHGMHLFGYYIGPKINIHPDGHLVLTLQHDQFNYYAGWYNRSVMNPTWEVNRWYELVITVDNTNPTNTIVAMVLDGEELNVDFNDSENGSVRIPFENRWDTFGVGWDHVDRNALGGLIGELFVQKGYLSSDEDSFSLQNVKSPKGCMMVKGNGRDDDKLILGSCENGMSSQTWTYENGMFRTALSRKCLQAGRGGKPGDGKKMRIYPCEASNGLQRFDWNDGGTISLRDFPEYCVVFRGVRAHLNKDPIILKECKRIEPKRRRWKAHAT